jgi:hypothetical protein
MNPALHYLFGLLSATTMALKIENEHLSGEDEDAHERLTKLVSQLEIVVDHMGKIDLRPDLEAASPQGGRD